MSARAGCCPAAALVLPVPLPLELGSVPADSLWPPDGSGDADALADADPDGDPLGDADGEGLPVPGESGTRTGRFASHSCR